MIFLFCKIKFRRYWRHYCTVSFNIRTVNEKENNLFKARASESKGFTSFNAFLWALVPFFTSLSLSYDLLLGHGHEKWMRDEHGRSKFSQGWRQVLTEWWLLCKFLSLKLPCFHPVAPSPTWTAISLCLRFKKTLESLLCCKEIQPVLNIHWKDWSLNSNPLATWCEELNHWKRPWCWEGLTVGGEGEDRGWDCWMSSPTQWTWIWVSSGSWWWTGKPGMLHGVAKSWIQLSDWTELNSPSFTV